MGLRLYDGIIHGGPCFHQSIWLMMAWNMEVHVFTRVNLRTNSFQHSIKWSSHAIRMGYHVNFMDVHVVYMQKFMSTQITWTSKFWSMFTPWNLLHRLWGISSLWSSMKFQWTKHGQPWTRHGGPCYLPVSHVFYFIGSPFRVRTLWWDTNIDVR